MNIVDIAAVQYFSSAILTHVIVKGRILHKRNLVVSCLKVVCNGKLLAKFCFDRKSREGTWGRTVLVDIGRKMGKMHE